MSLPDYAERSEEDKAKNPLGIGRPYWTPLKGDQWIFTEERERALATSKFYCGPNPPPKA